MKKFVIAILALISIPSFARHDVNNDVCFVTESHLNVSYQTREVESLVAEGKRICTVYIKHKDRTKAEQRLLLLAAMDFVKEGTPSLIYIPEEYEPFVDRHVPESLRDHVRIVKNRDKVMSAILAKLARDFQMDFGAITLLYDQSTLQSKRIWEKELKASKLPVKSVKIKSKSKLSSALVKLNKGTSRGIIINLLSEVKDTEFDRLLSYEEIKLEILTRNRLNLSVGIEKSRRFNEAIVFSFSNLTSEADVLLNKKVFKRLRMERLYLDNDWELIGGFLSERKS